MPNFYASGNHDDRFQKQRNDDNDDNEDHIYHISMTWIMLSYDVDDFFGSLMSMVWASLFHY